MLSPSEKAFLDVIARGEVPQHLSRADQYRVLVGGELLDSLDEHPRRSVYLPGLGVHSTAAGRYQFLSRTWDECVQALGLDDFGPEAQDRAAVYLIRRRGVLDDLQAGRLDAVLDATSWEWASLPGPDGTSRYGQWAPHSRADCRAFYRARLRAYGGIVLPAVPRGVVAIGAVALAAAAAKSIAEKVRSDLPLSIRKLAS